MMNLNFLAPDIQKEILFLPRVERARHPIREHVVRAIAAVPDSGRQRGDGPALTVPGNER